MHLTKNLRSHFLYNNISLDESAKVTFSVKDKSLLSSMKDEYALQMFSMENVQKLFEKNFMQIMALLPLSLIHKAMRSKTLPLRDIVYSLSLSFLLIYFHFLTVQCRNKKLYVKEKVTKNFVHFFQS